MRLAKVSALVVLATALLGLSITAAAAEPPDCARLLDSSFKVTWLEEALEQAHENGDLRRELDLTEELSQLQPENSKLHNKLARLYAEKNQNPKALHHLQRAIEGRLREGREIKTELELALVLALKVKNYPLMLAIAERGTELYPRNKKILGLKTRALQRLGRQEEALITADQQLALDPQNPTALGLKSQVLLDLDRFEEALALAEQQLKLRPELSVALVLKIQALMGLKRYREALEINTRLIQAEPNNVINYRLKTKLLRLLAIHE